MANSFDSNFTRRLARIFLPSFNSKRVLSKNVNTQLLQGKFNPASGENVDFKRPTDYVSVRTSNGDVSGETVSPILTGKATGTVQDYFTAFVEFDEADEAIKMDQKGEPGQAQSLLGPMATRIVTDLELDFGEFMKKNTGLIAGTYGSPILTWDDVANCDATLEATGIPMDAPWCMSVNPFTKRKLASNQRSLGAGGVAGKAIMNAHEKATITENFGGFDRVMTATTLASFTIAAGADRAGTLTGDPVVTYVGAKDTMTQTLAVTGFQANLVVGAGETIQISGRNRLNLSTRKLILDENGDSILFTGTVTTDVTLGSSGEGNITITGPAIYEAAPGAYNTADSAPVTNDIVTLLGTGGDVIQPNLFWHRDAYGIGSVPIKKLYSTDTIATTEDGLQFRVSKGTGFLENQNKVRVDFRPAYAVLNPFFAGQGYGTP